MVGASACGSSNASDNSSKASGEKTTVVNVGTMGTFSPYSIKNDDGSFTGYDIEVLKLIEKDDKTLKFNFQAMPFDSLFSSLDANKIQVIANETTKTKEREAKYTLTDTSYLLRPMKLIVKDGSPIKSMDDLKGKTWGGTIGDQHTKFMEEWNQKHGNPFTIKYYEDDFTTICRDIAAGRIDGTVNSPDASMDKAKKQHTPVSPVGKVINQVPVYFTLRKTTQGKELRDRLYRDLKELKNDGELSKLSVEWFKGDYTQAAKS